jgi:predicted TIM-barrel fold metal-dependent hydrolase
MDSRLPDLTGIPFIDAHMHPPLATAVVDVDGLRRRWYEGRAEHAAIAADFVAYRTAITRLSRLLGCDGEEGAVAAALSADPLDRRLERVVARAGVAGLVVDTGYPPPDQTVDLAAMAAGIVPTAPLLRLELLAGELLSAAGGFDDFIGAFDASLDGAKARGFRGFKSVIAYRSGLAVAAADHRAAADGFARERRRGTRRLSEKALLDLLLWRAIDAARRHGLAIQFHAGYGDRDIDLGGAGHPLRLRSLLDHGVEDVTLVILHGAWPHTAEAAWLAAVYPNVVLDVPSAIPPVGPSAVLDMWRCALAAAPLSRIHASTDSNGLIEQVWIGALTAREVLAAALAELLAAGALSARACEEVAAAVLAGNARRLYWGEAGA